MKLFLNLEDCFCCSHPDWFNSLIDGLLDWLIDRLIDWLITINDNFEFVQVMSLGILQCADAFLYVFTIFPVRLLLALLEVNIFLVRLLWRFFPMRNASRRRAMRPFPTTCVCEIIKGIIMLSGVYMFTFVDLSVMYHFLRGQAVVKLYIMFNMLEVNSSVSLGLLFFFQDIEQFTKNSIPLKNDFFSIFSFSFQGLKSINSVGLI